MVDELFLRKVFQEDLESFYTFQKEPEAVHMAAFTAKDPADRDAFDAFWSRILGNEEILIRTILFNGEVAGSVLSYVDEGKPEVSYWIGMDYWGKGIATMALTAFLESVNTSRPIYARVAADNLASRRVLEKCGFRVIGESRGFANARGTEIDELLLELSGPVPEAG